MSTERDWTEDFTHENGNYQNTCINCKQSFMGHKRRPICKACSGKPMSTERVSDEELERYTKAFAGHGCTFQFDHFESIFRELQQRRETDRKVIEVKNKYLLKRDDDSVELVALLKAISELLP